jgi:hypothetical protein
MPTTTNMNLDLPVVNTTPGPTWASSVNAAFEDVDSHDHSTGKGVKISPTGININADLPFAGNNATELRSARFNDQGTVQTTATDLGCLQLVSGDLWWVNGNGTGVQITSGAGLSFSSLGTIGGDFGQPGVTASVTYSDTTKIFSFLQDSGITAGLYGSKLLLADASGGALSVTLTADAATGAYTLTFPISAPTADTVLTFNGAGTGTFRTISGTAGEVTVTPSSSAHTVSLPSTITKSIAFTGVTSFTGGPGILPLGSVIATFPSLSGAYTCSATTTPDAFGFVQCNGQSVADATSPMFGATVPNINNNAFIMGNSVSGTAGGSNTKTLTTTELPAHTHDMSHGHSNTFALTGTTTFASAGHTHDMRHVHQWSYVSGSDGSLYGLNSRNPSTADFTTSSQILNSSAQGTGSGNFVTKIFSGLSSYYTGGAVDIPGNLILDTGAPSATAAVGIGGSVTSFTGNTASSGTGSSFDVRPSYITARYIMRVK